jgi:hypothetical protein
MSHVLDDIARVDWLHLGRKLMRTIHQKVYFAPLRLKYSFGVVLQLISVFFSHRTAASA